MMCDCDGGWDGGDGSLKRGGEWPWSAAVGRLPWFVQTMLTRGGEFGDKFLCRTISKYILF